MFTVTHLGLRTGYCQCRILLLLQGPEKNPVQKVKCKVMPKYQRNNKKLYKVTSGCPRGQEQVEGAAMFCVTVSISNGLRVHSLCRNFFGFSDTFSEQKAGV